MITKKLLKRSVRREKEWVLIHSVDLKSEFSALDSRSMEFIAIYIMRWTDSTNVMK